MWAITPGVASAPTYLALFALTLLVWCFSILEGADPSTRSSSLFLASWCKSWAFASRFSIQKSHIRFSWAFLRFSDVIADLSFTLQCRSWLSSPSSGIATICHLGPLFAFWPHPASLLKHLSVGGFLYHVVLVVSLVIMSPAPCHFCTVGHLPASCGQFLPQFTVSLCANFAEDISRAPCHCYMTGHLPAGGIQLLLESTISSGQFL